MDQVCFILRRRRLNNSLIWVSKPEIQSIYTSLYWMMFYLSSSLIWHPSTPAPSIPIKTWPMLPKSRHESISTCPLKRWKKDFLGIGKLNHNISTKIGDQIMQKFLLLLWSQTTPKFKLQQNIAILIITLPSHNKSINW